MVDWAVSCENEHSQTLSQRCKRRGMAFFVPYLTLLPEDAGQRCYPLREVFNGLRYLIRSGAPWRWIPHDAPPWIIFY